MACSDYFGGLRHWDYTNCRLFRASRVAQIMHINMLHERSHALSNIYSASVFSYLADDLRELQQLFQQQNKLH
ncbi:derepression protein [Escherichia coli]|nr:derepression protein [Escherichia coli]